MQKATLHVRQLPCSHKGLTPSRAAPYLCLQETLQSMFEITEDAALDPLPSRMGSPYGSLLRHGAGAARAASVVAYSLHVRG